MYNCVLLVHASIDSLCVGRTTKRERERVTINVRVVQCESTLYSHTRQFMSPCLHTTLICYLLCIYTHRKCQKGSPDSTRLVDTQTHHCSLTDPPTLDLYTQTLAELAPTLTSTPNTHPPPTPKTQK